MQLADRSRPAPEGRWCGLGDHHSMPCGRGRRRTAVTSWRLEAGRGVCASRSGVDPVGIDVISYGGIQSMPLGHE